jgi:hypothetical protein
MMEGDIEFHLRRIAELFYGHDAKSVLIDAANEIEKMRAALNAVPWCVQNDEWRGKYKEYLHE